LSVSLLVHIQFNKDLACLQNHNMDCGTSVNSVTLTYFDHIQLGCCTASRKGRCVFFSSGQFLLWLWKKWHANWMFTQTR